MKNGHAPEWIRHPRWFFKLLLELVKHNAFGDAERDFLIFVKWVAERYLDPVMLPGMVSN